MDNLNSRKLLIQQKNKIETDAVKLKKLTDHVPGMIFQCEMTKEGKISFDFISKGISKLHPSLTPESVKNNPDIVFSVIHPDDLPEVKRNIQQSFTDLSLLSVDFRVTTANGDIDIMQVRQNRKDWIMDMLYGMASL